MPGGKIAALAGILAAGILVACGSAGDPASDVAPGPSTTTAEFVRAVTTILDAESVAFATFFGDDVAALGTAAGMDAPGAEPAVIAFQGELTDAQVAARELEPPATTTLFFGSFLEHFDRFVGEAARIRATLENDDFASAADRYVRLKRGAFERLDFLRGRLALIEAG